MKAILIAGFLLLLVGGCGAEGDPVEDIGQESDAGPSDMATGGDSMHDLSAAQDFSFEQDSLQLDLLPISRTTGEIQSCEAQCIEAEGTCSTMESPLWGDIVGNARYDGGTETPLFNCLDEPEGTIAGLDREEELESMTCYCLI